jgi:hypothetical protein
MSAVCGRVGGDQAEGGTRELGAPREFAEVKMGARPQNGRAPSLFLIKKSYNIFNTKMKSYTEIESFITKWYWRYERQLSWFGLTAGFIVEATQLKRVDLLLENVWVLVHVAISVFGIIAINVVEKRQALSRFSEKAYRRIHFWLVMTIQFGFGGLFSAFFFLYVRSGNLATSWPFFALLIGTLIANEAFKFHYHRLVFQLTVLFSALFSFAIFLVPVLTHRIGDSIFLLSGLVSLLFISGVIALLWYISKERFKGNRRILAGSIGGVFLLVNLLYFTNIIPPLPLSLKDITVYHSVSPQGDGTYVGLREEKKKWDFFAWQDVVHKTSVDPVFVWSAVFSPTKLNTVILHEWQYYSEKDKKWVTEETIRLPIVGGRDNGYRTYSKKTFADAGLWRVTVRTESGQIIGRIRFKIETVQTAPALVQQTL